STMYGKIELRGRADKLLQPFAHFFAPPRRDGSIIYRPAFVGNHQIGVDANNFSIAFASLTRTIGIVETEKVGNGLLKRDAVQCKTIRKRMHRLVLFDVAVALAFEKSRLHRIRDPVYRV